MTFDEKLHTFMKENLPENTPFLVLVGLDGLDDPERDNDHRQLFGVLNGKKNTLITMLAQALLTQSSWREIIMAAFTLAFSSEKKGGAE